MRYGEVQKTGAAPEEDYQTRDLHARYQLNTHLSFNLLYLIRDRSIAGRGETEDEATVRLDYIVGKFAFQAEFDRRRCPPVMTSARSISTSWP